MDFCYEGFRGLALPYPNVLRLSFLLSQREVYFLIAFAGEPPFGGVTA